MGKVRKTNGLLFKFAIVFTIFTLVTLVFSGFATYENQNQLYKKQCEQNLKNIAKYLSELFAMDGEDFRFYQNFCLEHGTDMNIPVDFENSDEARSKFEKMFAEKHPGKVLGEDISFDELDYDLKLAYAEYNHEYYYLECEKAKEKFGIAYAYYIVPTPDQGDDYVMYLLDRVREPREDDPDHIHVCGCYPQVIESHGVLWEAWETGKSPEEPDSFDNEFGKTYAYYTPLYINGEKLGLIVTEVNIDAVNEAILHNTLMQALTIGSILIISVLVMLIFINRRYIKRIGYLESGVREYTAKKDPVVADIIESNAVGKNEIASLSKQTADMVRELDSYITEIKHMTSEKERVSAELNVAAKMQADMLQSIFPDRSDIDIYATMTPAREMGGDFYDFFMIDDDHMGLVMADVSGKGIPAAMFMIVAKTLIKIRTTAPGTPAQMLWDINNTLCAENASKLFVTAWFGILTLSSGELTWANAGHEPPALMHENGRYELLEVENMPPLAAMEEMEFIDEKIQLQKGDRLFLYTDGVPEAKAPDGSRFGMDKMLDVLNQNKDKDLETLLKTVKQEIDRFSDTNDPFDDVTMMSVIWHGKDQDKNSGK